jgi:hypothetical protein
MALSDDLTSESSISDRDDNGWEDAEADEEEVQVVSLFDEKVFDNAKSMLEYCKERYSFDFISVQRQHSQFTPTIHTHHEIVPDITRYDMCSLYF